SVTIGVKAFEILVMAFALGGLTLNSLPMQLGAVFLMGVHSAIFSPSKYGLLPELLAPKRLSWGNGVLELGTFLAIILGTMSGGLLSDFFQGRQQWSGLILILLAVLGLLASRGIERIPAADPVKRFRANFLADFLKQIQQVRQD